MSIHEYPPAELEPRKLSKEEIEDPYQVIYELFDYAHLPQIRESIWEWLKATTSGNYHKLSVSERGNLLYLYEKIEKLIEAAHIIHNKRVQEPTG
jgi:hypothetical protein